MDADPRRSIPRTDALLASPDFSDAVARLGVGPVKAAIRAAQQRAREGVLSPDAVGASALEALGRPSSVRTVLNCTGIVVHTNLGRAPLSDAAVTALAAASGYTDLELDLGTNERSSRDAGVRSALLAAVPGAEDALVVNNGAAALVLAVTALASGGEVVVSRGELVEIGDGFRIADLVTSTGVRLREVGATNRTHLADYEPTPDTRALLVVHPSNFTVVGYTAGVPLERLGSLAATRVLPLIADLGSGLLCPDPATAPNALTDEPNVSDALAAGASVVVCSADKLLGGPQAGLIVGRADLIERLRRHPLARALRLDKLRLAALEAALASEAPVLRYRRLGADDLAPRARALADAVGGDVVSCQGWIGGGGAPGVPLPGWAVALPSTSAERLAGALRTGTPAVLARVERGRVLIDLRCVDPDADPIVADAVRRALTVIEPDQESGTDVHRTNRAIVTVPALECDPDASNGATATDPLPLISQSDQRQTNAPTGSS